MGTYINIGNAGFQRARNSEYVDKSGLIAAVNSTLFTERCFSCVTRCRRFGKSMAAKMLCAYYDQSCDSRSLFADLQIARDENTSILSYNNENSLACVLSIAYFYARNDYVMHRELPSGKGFADIVLMPRKHVESPAIIVELKYNRDADSAIDQIRRKQYPSGIARYSGELLLVGINYDKKQKTHQCKIERIEGSVPSTMN